MCQLMLHTVVLNSMSHLQDSGEYIYKSFSSHSRLFNRLYTLQDHGVLIVLLCHLSFQPDGPLITWVQKTGTNYIEIRSKLKGDDSVHHFTRVDIREEKYKLRKNIPVGDFPHHIFHLRPPLVLQNLLPFTISVGSIVSRHKWKRFMEQ